MPTPVVKQFTSWSWSRYRDHLQCPLRAKLTHLDKLDKGAPKGPALIRGDDVHKKAERYLKDGGKLPPELKSFSKEFAHLRKVRASSEGKFAVSKKWELVDFFDWDRAWGRMVADAHYAESKEANVIDFKTGKIYPENDDQLELYAIPVFLTYPDVKLVNTELWYVDQGQIGGARTYNRKDLPKMITGWARRVVPLLADKKFVARPGDHCGYCNFRKAKGGPCKY